MEATAATHRNRTMALIKPHDVVRGDILIHKSFALPGLATIKHGGIRAGQFVSGSPIRSNSVHASIAIAGGEDKVWVIESTGDGVDRKPCDTEADVFRLIGPSPLPDKAASVAERLKDWTKRHRTSGGKAGGHYNYWRAFGSVVRPEDFDKKAERLVTDVKAAIDNDSDYEGGFFCSMLVVICYDVAGEELNMPSPPIPKDPMNLNPSNLHYYLLKHPDVWQMVGTLNEPGGAWDGWMDRIFKRESSHN
jgi:hypothetical protein